jgi:hypothetical protein
MKRFTRVLIIILGGLTLLCLAAAGISVLANRTLPAPPKPAGQLDALDKQRLIEAIHLRRSLGDLVWPGFGQADIPVILWNRNDSFLVGVPSAPAGWQRVSGDEFQGQAYFHQKTDDPQNFAVPLDGTWAASMATKGETDSFLIETFHNFLPPVVNTIFPYRLMIQPSEVQISAVAHESFHVFQQYHAAQRLAAAEAAHKLGDAYWAADPEMTDDWIQEIDLLYQAVRAGSDEEAVRLASQFLEQREARRQNANLSADLVDYERQLEWEEGLAKYIELAIWQAASQHTGYIPLLVHDPDFKSYRTFESRFSQELSQMKRQAKQEGESRLYYTGMATGFLLDRLAPGWKDQVFKDGVWVEDLLGQAVANPVN